MEALKRQKEFLEAQLTLNLQHIIIKQKEPSRRVELEPLGEVLARIRDLIDVANAKAAEHNRIVANLAQ